MKNQRYLWRSLVFAGIMLICGHATSQNRELPDNIQTANCTFAPEATEWGIVEKWSSTDNVSTLINPLVGDVNNDGIPEIVCFAPSGSDFYNANTVLVFNTRTHAVVHTFTVPGNASTVDAAPYGMVKLHTGHVLLAVCTQNNNMYGYDLTANGTTPMWTVATGFPAPNVGFVDFNGDGYPEIYVGNKIFDAETGVLLVTNASVTNFGGSYAHTGSHKLPSPCVANLTGDSKPELVLGNEVYEIVITNRTGTSGNSMTLSASCTPPSGIAVDGHPQVVDFNMDGYLDVFISNKETSSGAMGMYVWDVHNNSILGSIVVSQTGSGKSIPLIADIDNDNNIEVVIQSRVSGNKVQAYKFNRNTNTFTMMWDKAVDEDSYSNGATTFDFNNDGEMEVLISDQSTIKILEGSTGTQLTQLTFGECTVMQYPVIADVDADGSAEIAICGQFGAGHTNSGHLVVFCSSTVPWASARKVWNQYMYNVTNVNEDLSVMLQLYNNATPFTDPQGNVRRPFNNFLQQATTIDQYGRPFYAVPDVMAVNATVDHSGNEVVIDFNYTNQGDNTLNAPYYITVFANHFGGTVLLTQSVDEPLRRNQSATAVLHLSASQLCNMQNLNNLVIAVNCNGGGIAQNGNLQPECDITNNMVTIPYTGHSSSSEFWETSCGEYVWNGHTYTVSGNFQQTFTNTFGCDSLVTLHLTINEAIYHEWSYQTCDSYSWNGVNYNHSGNYTQTFDTQEGCDSIVTLHLTIHPSYQTEWNYQACESYTWNGHTYSQTGNYTQNLSSIHGCDSIVTLHLTINSTIETEWEQQACNEYVWNGQTYTETGDYVQEFTSIQGCDSIVTLHLTINDAITTEWSWQACDSYEWNGQTYSATGDYVQEFSSIQGCDSIVTLHLTIADAIETDWAQEVCDHFDWNDETYYTSGDYVQNFTSIQGCDSIVTLHLTISDAIETDWSHQACTDFTWNGQNYSQSGDYVQEFVTQQGCDSIVTLHLLINDVLETEWEQVACNNYTWNDETYYESGDFVQEFVSVQGCDSIVKLHLTIADPVETEWSAQACTTFEWNGITYSEPGDYKQYLTTLQGCDSIVTLHLAINDIYKVEIDTVHCGAYLWNGQEYTESGTYEGQFVSIDGCDSIVVVNLTVKPMPDAIGEIQGYHNVYVASNITNGIYEYTIEPVGGSAYYEWELDGADWVVSFNETVCKLMVTSPGTAKLIARAWNDCGYTERYFDIYAGFFGTDEDQTVSIKVYPNPANGKALVEAEAIEFVRIFDLQGQLVGEMLGQGSERLELNLRHLAPAIYTIEVMTQQGVAKVKLSVVR